MTRPEGAAPEAAPARRGMLGNFLSLSLATWGSQAAGFLVIVYVARTLGAVALGQVVLAQAVVVYFRLAGDMGFDLMGSRRIAANPLAAAATAADLTGCRLANAAAAAGLLVLAACATDRVLPIGWLMVAFGLSLAPAALSLEWAFMGLERMDLVGLARLAAAAVWLLLVVVFAHQGASPLVVPLAYLTGQACAAGLLYVLFRRMHGPIGIRFERARWAAAFRDASPIGASILVIQIYVGFGLVALGFLAGGRAAGLYAAPHRMFLFLAAASSMFGGALYPRLAALREEGRDRFDEAVRIGFRVMVLAGVPIAVGGMLVAEPLVAFVYGQAYAESGRVFRWLVPGVVPIFASTVLGYALLAAGGERRYLHASIGGAVVNVAANLALIPHLQLLGPVVATLCSEGLILLMMAAYARPFARVEAGHVLTAAAAAAALMAGALLLVGPASLAVQIVVGAAVYASAVAVFRGLTKADLASLRELARSSPLAPGRPLD